MPIETYRPYLSTDLTDIPTYRHSESSESSESSLAYNTRFDTEAFQNLLNNKALLSRDGFEKSLHALNALTRTNIETSIAERYNTEIHTATYTIKDGQLLHSLYSEPFLHIIKRGQEFRQKTGSHDIDREKAEVAGFTKVESIFASGELGRGGKVIVISPKGIGHSAYGHNFYDLFEKQGTEITMSRLTSKNSYEKFKGSAKQIDPFNTIPENPTGADFLKKPLVTYKTLDQIHELMDPDEKTISQKELAGLLEACAPLVQIYMQKLASSPQSATHEDYLDILRTAHLARNGAIHHGKIRNVILPAIATACGISGAANTPYSVAEFGYQDQFGTLNIHCEECGAIYNRTPGNLEPNCRHCGGTKGIAC